MRLPGAGNTVDSKSDSTLLDDHNLANQRAYRSKPDSVPPLLLPTFLSITGMEDGELQAISTISTTDSTDDG